MNHAAFYYHNCNDLFHRLDDICLLFYDIFLDNCFEIYYYLFDLNMINLILILRVDRYIAIWAAITHLRISFLNVILLWNLIQTRSWEIAQLAIDVNRHLVKVGYSRSWFLFVKLGKALSYLLIAKTFNCILRTNVLLIIFTVLCCAICNSGCLYQVS